MFEVQFDTKLLNKVVSSFDAGGETQKKFTGDLMRLSMEYMPRKTGELMAKTIMVPDGSGIIYDTPYARYHWYGKLKVDPITRKGAFFKEGYGFWSRPKEQPNSQKVLTNIDMHYQGSPMRGSHWAERCFVANENHFINSTIEFAEGLAK